MASSTTSLAAELRWVLLASRVHDDSYRDLVISSESEDREGDSSPGRASVTNLLLASDDDVPQEGLGRGAHHTFAVGGRVSCWGEWTSIVNYSAKHLIMLC